MNLRDISNSVSLYIMLPGGCNAHCHFCCWSRKNEPFAREEYISKLKDILPDLADNAHSLNLLGGEPLISPFLEDILNLIGGKLRMPKIVVTTNGSALLNKIQSLALAVDHVNLSRHAISDKDNELVFGKRAFLPAKKILTAADELIDCDIDLSVNCVLHEKTPIQSKRDVLDFIKFCKDNGAVSVCFKKLEGDSLDPVKQQLYFRDIPLLNHSTCDVCRTDSQIIGDMVVYWQAALKKRSAQVRDLIIQPNLNVTSDWPGTNLVTI